VRDAEAKRKAAKSKNRRTGNAVAHSAERFDIHLPFGSHADMTFGFTSPAQLDQTRVYRLCAMYSQALFYWITYNNKLRKGGFWPGGFFPIFLSVRSDWGNPLHERFMDTVAGWELRLGAVGAKEHFKVAIRKHPVAPCWSWAYEWNANTRIVGLFGDEIIAEELVNAFPRLEWKVIRRGNEITRYRAETRISPERDRLFSW